MRVLRALAMVTSVSLSLSCSVFFQKSVRSDKADCSRSLFWIASDLVLAGAMVGVVLSPDGQSSPTPAFVLPAEIIAGVFVASAAIGVFKRHNCGRYRREHPPLAICDGGRRNINNLCYCADGQTWNGQTCQGTASAGNCAGGAFAFGPPQDQRCFCLDGFRLDNGQCVELQCTGGSFAQVDQCVCPNGTSWDNTQCVAPPEQPQGDDTSGGGGDAEANPEAPCPEGSVLGGQFGDQCMSCPGGAVPSGLYNQECACPDGTVSNGSECVVPQAGAPAPVRRPPPAPRRQPSRVPPAQRSSPGRTAPPPQRNAPPPAASNPPYHATFQQNASEPQNKCHPFVNEPSSNMGACSAWCTGLLAKRLRCQCAPGGC
jgi:hypothetical protein